ncbi:MAG TPA: hypothetical protein VI612_02055 [Candidatus Nanoarchaeia archaeon]|nr:hypothetical protein [Candidatus Nanoarchaeia archaeon]
MENRYALIGILVIMLIGVGAVVHLNTATGAISTSSYGSYGYTSKIYGGAIEKAFRENPKAISDGYAKSQFVLKNQQYLYANKDKWDCSYGKEAESSPYPCVFDDSVGKYCCIIPSKALSLSNPTRSLSGSS